MARLGQWSISSATFTVAVILAVLMQGSAAAGTRDTVSLEKTLAEIADDAQGRVGVCATHLASGETVMLRGAETFPMQSVYKFPIAMAVLAAIDAGQLRLDTMVRVEPGDHLGPLQHSPIREAHPAGVALTIEDLLRFMVQESDGTACDVLLCLLGGPDAAMAYLRELGIEGVTVATTEREMGTDEQVQYRNSATPAGMVSLLRAFHEGRGLTDASRERLQRWMTETKTGKRRLKALLPRGTTVTHKTGSSRTFDGLTRATNDVGLITLPDGGKLAMAVFVADSRADDSTREAVIARMAHAVWTHYQDP